MTPPAAAPEAPARSGSGAPAAQVPLWRRALPWVLAAALMAFIFARIDAKSVWASLKAVDPLSYFTFIAVFSIVNLFFDVLATWRAYRHLTPDMPFRSLLVVRGASYLPAIVNYHVGQAYVTYLLSRRHGVPLLRVAGATLLVYATHLSNFIVVATLALPYGGDEPWITRSVVPSFAGVLGYFAVIAWRPAFLRKYAIFGVLFETGLVGHLWLLLWRLPHVFVLSLGLWGAYRFFDVYVPAPACFAVLPVILLFSALPFTPQGIGTRELIAMHLLVPYVLSSADRAAPIVAAGTAWVATTAVAQAIIGLSFARPASRLLWGAPAEPALAESASLRAQ